MAIVIDASTSGTITTTASVSHTPVSTPRAVKVDVVCDDANADVISDVTYGGVAMTEVAGSPVGDFGGDKQSVHTFFLGGGIPTGTQNATVTVTSGTTAKRVTVTTWTAAGDTVVQDTTTIAQASGANPSATLSLGGFSCACSIAFHSGINAVTGITPLSGWTARDELDFGSNTSGNYTYDTVGTADVTMGWTASTDTGYCIGVAIKEVTATIPSTSANNQASFPVIRPKSNQHVQWFQHRADLFLPMFAPPQTTTFNASGTWFCPADTNVLVECWGGGAGGTNGMIDGGLGGGGGAYAASVIAVTVGNYAVTIGTGGTVPAGNGGDTDFVNPTTVMAKGGTSSGGDSALSVGDVKFAGGDGGTTVASTNGGGGGGSATNIAVGGNGGTGAGGGDGGTGEGNGGAGGDALEVGGPGWAPGGGGGGGSTAFAGGAGAAGRVTITMLGPMPWYTYGAMIGGMSEF